MLRVTLFIVETEPAMTEAKLKDQIRVDADIADVWRFLADLRSWPSFVDNLESWEPEGDWVSGVNRMGSGKRVAFEGKVVERVFEERIVLEMQFPGTDGSSRITYHLEHGRGRRGTLVTEELALRLKLSRPLGWLLRLLMRITKPRGLSNLARLKRVIEGR